MGIEIIENKIYEIRGQKVMLDFDLAQLYEVETRVLNQSVKRNIIRFPEDFMFRLSAIEWEVLKSQNVISKKENQQQTETDLIPNKYSSSQIVMIKKDVLANKKNMSSQFVITSNNKRPNAALPFAFTEHGVAMLASVLKSKKAIEMNIAIVRTFIAIKQYIKQPQNITTQINDLRLEMQKEFGKRDVQISQIYDALENLLDVKENEQEQRLKWEQRNRIGFKK